MPNQPWRDPKHADHTIIVPAIVELEFDASVGYFYLRVGTNCEMPVGYGELLELQRTIDRQLRRYRRHHKMSETQEVLDPPITKKVYAPMPEGPHPERWKD